MKTMNSGAVTLLVACLVASTAQANRNGRIGQSGKQGVTCLYCHTGAASQASVSVQGPASLGAGQTGLYEVVISGGPAAVGGVNVAVDNGATLQANAGLRLAQQELTHTEPKAFSNNQVRFTFSVVAPTSGTTFKIYAAGNSANGDGSNSGDIGAFTSRDVAVTGGGQPQPDAGTPDAGTDAGTDGGGGGGPGGPAGPPPADPSPYGCTAAGGAPALLLLLVAGLLARRRREA
jgi:MYXO-CTERM domain-containing protein